MIITSNYAFKILKPVYIKALLTIQTVIYKAGHSLIIYPDFLFKESDPLVGLF